MTAPRVVVITGSVRRERLGATIAAWVVDQASGRADLQVEALDLGTLTIPDDMAPHPDVDALASVVGSADALVIVTPEYNHSYPGPLKKAIDALRDEWTAKPVGFVSYGGISGGLRAVEALRLVFAELHAVSVRECVSFPHAWNQLDEQGRFVGDAAASKAADRLFDQLWWWASALRAGRSRQPYPASPEF